MKSFLIVATNLKSAEEKITNLLTEYAVGRFDVTVIEPEETTTKSTKKLKSIGIATIRTLQKSAFLSPVSGKIKAIIIKQSELLTIEAQNALLKLLEEPPPHAIIVLATSNKNALLPTILSRCFIIDSYDQQKNSEKSMQEYGQLLNTLLMGEIGEKLKLAEQYGKTNESAAEVLEHLLRLIQVLIIEKIQTNNKDALGQFSKYAKQFQKTYIILKTTNANPRFTLENLFLSVV